MRALSRRTGPGLATGALVTGVGLGAALGGVETVRHLATGRSDVLAAFHLVAAARAAGIRHLAFISIVGVDRIPFPYYRQRVAIEELVSSSGIPFTIQRATQFHSFLEQFFTGLRFFPVLLAPTFPVQSIAAEEVAALLVQLVGAEPAGRAPDIGGPAARPLRELASVWRRAAGARRPVVPVTFPGRTSRAVTARHALVPGPAYGRTTFEEHLASRYARAQ
ncbi:NAD(P)H-binding [Modestobacter sp. DSM 44400]|nr:NAD(P)H-binding [Modestobacter sp. DSM 44400]